MSDPTGPRTTTLEAGPLRQCAGCGERVAEDKALVYHGQSFGDVPFRYYGAKTTSRNWPEPALIPTFNMEGGS